MKRFAKMPELDTFAFQKMQDFLSLSETEQRTVVCETGDILINSRYGDIQITLFRVKDFFVKIMQGENGDSKIEVMDNFDNIRLFGDMH